MHPYQFGGANSTAFGYEQTDHPWRPILFIPFRFIQDPLNYKAVMEWKSEHCYIQNYKKLLLLRIEIHRCYNLTLATPKVLYHSQSNLTTTFAHCLGYFGEAARRMMSVLCAEV